MNHKARVKERLSDLPNRVWDCEACDTHGSMQLRRSSLNTGFYADDVLLKCQNCRRVRTHGIPFANPETFSEELKARDGRVIDFARDSYNPSETLEALGYTAKAKEVSNGK